MLIANVDGQRSFANPESIGRCDICDSEVIPKCGRIVTWHWAHKTLEDCDTWAESITQWHADWQSRFPKEMREIPIGKHRADILLSNGRVLEFQHSGISVDQIEEREAHYGDMIWIFDAVEAANCGRIDLRIKDWNVSPGLRHCSFRWRHPRLSVFYCRKPVFFDIGDSRILHLRRLYPDAPHGGWGTVYPLDRFLTDCAGITSLEIGAVASTGYHDWGCDG